MMDYVKIRTVAADHPRFLEAGLEAAALWSWSMLYAGRHETDGLVPLVAVVACSWFDSRPRAAKAAQRLVEVGLWTETDGGYVIVGWERQGNKTRAQLEERRAAEREKKAGQRRRDSSPPSETCPPPCPPGTPEGTPSGVLNSLSRSPSGSRSSSETEIPPAGDHPCATGRPTLDAPLPDTWRARAAGGEATTGERVDLDAAWVGFRAWCVDDERRPFTEARWIRWVNDERKRAKERRVSGRYLAPPRQTLGDLDEHPWIASGGGGLF